MVLLRLETRRRPLGSAAIAAAGGLGCVAVLSRQGATALDTIPTVAGAACGVAALVELVELAVERNGQPLVIRAVMEDQSPAGARPSSRK